MIIDLIILAFSLGIDAFFVALSISLMLQNKSLNKLIIFSLLAAFFQALMPMIGYFITYLLNSKYMEIIQKIDHYLVFLIFSYLAYGMYKSYKENNEEDIEISYKSLFLLSIATSIDALGAGLMIFSQKYNIYYSASIIAFITLLMCLFSVVVGKLTIKQNILKILGCIMLLFLGLKIMITHTINNI